MFGRPSIKPGLAAASVMTAFRFVETSPGEVAMDNILQSLKPLLQARDFGL